MRTRSGMMALVAGGLLLLSAGAAEAGGGVTPQNLQGLFVFNDEDQGGNHCSNVEINGATHQVVGVVTGIGLNDDTVTLTYSTPFVDSVRAQKERGSVRQRRQAQIDIDVAPGGASATPAYTGSANPDAGRVRGSVRKGGSNARVVARFRLGEGLSAMTPVPDVNQLNTIVTAFEDRDDVRLREKSGNLTLQQRGISNPTTCP